MSLAAVAARVRHASVAFALFADAVVDPDVVRNLAVVSRVVLANDVCELFDAGVSRVTLASAAFAAGPVRVLARVHVRVPPL